jgi:hypothetical protein
MFEPGHKKIAGRTKGTPNKASMDIKALATSIFDDPAYRRALRDRIIRGKAIEIEKLFFHYVVGKPAETIKHEDGDTPLSFTLTIADSNGSTLMGGSFP